MYIGHTGIISTSQMLCQNPWEIFPRPPQKKVQFILMSLVLRVQSLLSLLYYKSSWAGLSVSGGCFQRCSWVHQKYTWANLLVFTFGLTARNSTGSKVMSRERIIYLIHSLKMTKTQGEIDRTIRKLASRFTLRVFNTPLSHWQIR